MKNITLSGCFLLAACSSQPEAGIPDAAAEPMSGLDALTFFRERNLTSGWNLGNTLDSHNNGIAGESLWGNPRINQELINGVKAAGFDVIRIPVTWMGHIGGPRDYRISESRLRRIAEVVHMARDAGLVVIINLHHDGATQSRVKEAGWLSISKASKNKDDYTAITAQYTAVWKQIAGYFKNDGDWLIFESFNELHDGGWGSGEIWPQFETLNNWNQIFTDTVRKTGGNNSSRYLILGAYSQKPSLTLQDTFVLPKDSASHKQIVSFHYYDPYEFGIEGTRPVWGSDADKQTVVNDFSPFREKFIDNNIPVIIGECGAVLQLYPDDPEKQEQARLSRREYLSWIFTTANEYGLLPVYWDNGSVTGNGEKFGLINRQNGTSNSEESDFLLKAMSSSPEVMPK